MCENSVPQHLGFVIRDMPSVFMHAVDTCFYHFVNEAFLIFRTLSHQQIKVGLIGCRIVELDSGEQFIDRYSKGIYNSDDGLKACLAFGILNMAYVGYGEFRLLGKTCL